MKEILRIITSKSDVSRVLPELESANNGQDETVTGRFLQGLLNDTFADDDEAAKALYQSDRSDQRYRTLKSRVFERLLHSVLFLQVKQPEHSEYLSYYYKCTRNLICAQSLMRFASRTAGFEVAEKTLSIAEKYQFTDICLTLCKMLSETAAVWTQRHKFERYRDKASYYLEVLAAEHKSDALLDHYLLEQTITSRTWQYMIAIGESTLIEMQELTQKYGTHALKLNLFRLRIVLAEFKEEPLEHIAACNEAINYLELNPHLSQPARLGEFRLRMVIMQMQSQLISAAYQYAEVVIGSFRTAGTNWYLAVFFAALSSLRIGDYESAAKYIHLATSQRQYVLQSDSTKENWTIVNAYLIIAYRLGLATSSNTQSNAIKQFRLSTYLNSVPEESKKKKISNIVILISHVCFLILEHDFDAAERRIEYLRVYVSRYLKEREYHRVRLFLRMFQAFPRYSFDPDAIRKANSNLLDQLVLTAGDHTNSIYEYIQFETLYEGILNYLEQYEASIAA